MCFTVSICKDGAGYNFENGTRASVGSNGLGYTFSNGAQVHGKPIAGGKLQQVKSAWTRENLATNNKGADQHVRPRRPFSANVIRLVESIIFKLATGALCIF